MIKGIGVIVLLFGLFGGFFFIGDLLYPLDDPYTYDYNQTMRPFAYMAILALTWVGGYFLFKD